MEEKNMNKALIKKLMLSILLIIVIITLLQNFSLAKSENIQILKKSEKEYIIYIQNLLNNKFKFAFANQKDENESNLKFYDSALDTPENGNNIAYIDEDIYNTYFNGKAETFLWIDGTEVKAEKIDLLDALTEEIIQEFNNITKKIPVKFGQLHLVPEIVNEVKITRSMGTINFEDSSQAQYSYKILKVTSGSKEEELINLAIEMNKLENKNIYDKLLVYSKFKKVYEEVKPKNGWEAVENNTIKQPQDSKKGEQYLVWIQNGQVVDLQIMTCDAKYTPEYETKKIIEKEVTKLPVTGESIALYVTSAILIILIATFTIIKFKSGKSNEQKNM